MPDSVLFLGCGDLGGRTALRLLAAGSAVQALRRRPEALPEGVSGVAFDLMSKAGRPVGLDRADTVVFMLSAGRADEARYRAVYVDCLQRALTFPAVADAKRLVFVSSTSVYGQRDGQWVDEDSVTAPERYNGRVLLKAESVARSHPGAVIVRLAGLYGPGRERNIRWARERRPCVYDPPQFTNRIHIDDAAALLAHLIGLEQPEACYIGVDCEPAPQHEVMAWLAAAQGLEPPPALKSTEVSGPGSKRCSNARARQSGFTYRYPTYREGYSMVLQTRPSRPEDDGSPTPGATPV
ncbi:MAG: NAD(P)H-binding protein [Pseudomonadota bacterium]